MNLMDFTRFFPVKFSGDDDFENIYHYFIDTEQNSKLVYVYTVNLDASMIDASHKIRNKGFDIELYYVDISGIDDDDIEAKNDLADLLLKSNIRGYLLTPRTVEIKGGKEEVQIARGKEKARVRPKTEEKEKVKAYEKQA